MNNKWILIVDGERAKILSQHGQSLLHVQPTYHANEMGIVTDKAVHKPGRLSRGVTSNQSVYSPHTDCHTLEKESFIKKIADIINKNYVQFNQLVIIAPAHILGLLRQELNEHVLNKTSSEITKDLTRSSLNDIRKYVEYA